MRRIMVGILRLADDAKMREHLLRKLGVAARGSLRKWVQDYSGFPAPLKNEILLALQRAENGS